MPLPTPKKGEKKSDFISRCMGNGTMRTEYPDRKQRAAVCYSQWRRKNKKSEDVMSKKLPKGALRFVSPEATVCAFTDDGDVQKMKMTVYSGKPIEDHWYWGRLAIDLNGGKFTRSKYPVLENHATDRKIAFSGKPIVSDKIELDPDTTKFVDTEVSKEFRKLSAEGFPYQASIHATPLTVEWVKSGESVDVNGYKLKGPGAVWRQWEYQEASVCVFGWDSKTSASAFSRDETEEVQFEEIGNEHDALDNKQEPESVKEVKEEMEITVEMLRKDYPEIVKALQDEVKADFENRFESIQSEFSALSESVKALQSENKKLQKENAINREKSIKAEADAIFTEALSNSTIREDLYPKVRVQLSYNDFVSEDGKFDAEKFSEEVKKEVDSWQELIGNQNVLGGGAVSRDVTSTEARREEALKKENEKVTDELLDMAGYTGHRE